MSVAVVTGASGAMGSAFMRALAAQGHEVIGVDQTPAASDAHGCALLGSVTDPSLAQAALQQALGVSADVYLVNAAGVTMPATTQADEAWRATLDVNLSAPFVWSRLYAEAVRDGRIKGGALVFIGSLATAMGFPGNPAYQASKAGVLGLSRAFAFDLGPFGIRSNCVSPGYIKTPMTQGSFNNPAQNAARRAHTLLDRWGEPEDVAGVVAFLCSPAAAYVTGTNIFVDGGWTCRGLIEPKD